MQNDQTEIKKQSGMMALLMVVGVAIVLIWCHCRGSACIFCDGIRPGDLSLKPELTHIGPVFGIFFVVSLVVERSLEVVVSSFRNIRTEELKLAVDENKADPSVYKMKAAELRLYTDETRKLTLWLGLALGLLVSTAGFRVLREFVTADPGGLFLLVDVIVSGLFISGGSDSIHKIINVYDEFTLAMRERAKMTTPTKTP